MKIKFILLPFIVGLLPFSAARAESNAPPEQLEVKYTAAIEGRTAEVLKILALPDTQKIAKVHDAIIAQYRALKAWHDENDAALKAAKSDTNAVAKIRASLKTRHENFLTELGKQLTPEQIELVKDKLTYGKVQFTFNGYLAAYPNLADEHKQKILEFLKIAREEAMDGGSADEKTAVFQKCKGKINNYLSKQGLHPEKKNKVSSPETNAPPK